MASIEENIAPLAPTVGRAGVDQNQQQPQYQQNMQQPQMTASAPDFLSVARRIQQATAMSNAGAEYVAGVKKFLAERAPDIKVVALSYPAESLAFVLADKAIALIFSDAVRVEDNVPTIAHARNVLLNLRDVVGANVNLIRTVVVTPDMYPLVTNMGVYIANALISSVDPDINALTVESLEKYQVEVSNNPTVYDNFVKQYDPHGVPARADLKLTVSLNVPRRNSNNVDLFGKVDIERTDIAAIGAYVIFSQHLENGNIKFLPEIHISNIVSSIMTPGIVDLLLGLAATQLYDNQFWKAQFSNLASNMAPNIGNLVVNQADNQAFKAENLAQRDKVIADFCSAPMLFLDIAEGRAVIPGLERFALPEWAPQLITSANNFMCGASMLSPAMTPAVSFYQEYIGFYQNGSELFDSRWIDYLNLMIRHPELRESYKALLSHQPNADLQLNVIRQCQPDVQIHYDNHVVALSGAFIRPLQNVIRTRVKLINAQQQMGAIDITGMMQMGREFAANPGNVGYYQQASVSPFNQIYGVTGLQQNLFK